MTNEELVADYHNGNKKAMDEIVLKNKGLVYKLAIKYNNYSYSYDSSSIDKDDLIQEGFIGLMVAVNKYEIKTDNPAKFSTYAVFWIRQKISRFMNTKLTSGEISLNKTYDEGDSLELIDLQVDENDQYLDIEERSCNQELHEALEEAMRKNTTLMEREILKLNHGWNNTECMSINELADLFHIPQRQVFYRKYSAINKLRRSSWGAQMIREIYKENQIRSYDNVDSLLNQIDYYSKNIGALNSDTKDILHKYTPYI